MLLSFLSAPVLLARMFGTVIFLSLVIFAFKLLQKHFNVFSTGLPLPPGPPGHCIFGNSIPHVLRVHLFNPLLLSLMTCSGYRKFEEWTKQYGPVFSLRQGPRTIIVVGRVQAAIDIMEKEGTNTAGRPRSIAAGETLSGGMRVMFAQPGERFKKLRRALHAHLQPKIVTTYNSILEGRAKQHILDIIEDPRRHQDHAKRYAASVVMAIAYGRLPKGRNDPDIKNVSDCLTRLGNNMRPGYWQVDVYPFLKYVPGYLTELREGHVTELELFKRKLFEVKDRMARGEEVSSCFGKYILEQQTELELSDGEAAYLAGGMFGAGSDTTASAISVVVMASACYPEAQCKVQQELDQVIGRDRAPRTADMEILPQTYAYVLETLRWRPVTAGGLPHRATKELVWGGYRIPRDATIISNVWGISRDPQYFPDPETFNPQRWFDGEGKLRDDLKTYAFGFGRRICPGQHIATASIFLNAALILWAMKTKEDPRYPIDELAFTESANAHPMPFKVIFEPRAAETFDGVKDLLDDYGI